MPRTQARRYEPQVEYFPPTQPHTESREATVARALSGSRSSDPAGTADADSTTLSGANRRIAARAGVAAAIGGAIGAVAGLILSLIPGPFETGGTGGTVGYMVVLGMAVAVVVGLLSTLLLLEREDGRVEEQLERSQQHGEVPSH